MSYFSCLLVGGWGTGKTTAAATAPGPVLFLDMDNKIEKMVNLKDKMKSGKVMYWSVKEPLSGYGLSRLATSKVKPGGKAASPRPKGYLQLVEKIEELEKNGCKFNGKKVETIVLDSYTTVNEHIKRLLLSVNSSVTMTQPLWGALLVNFEELNNTLLRLPANIVVVAHQKLDKDDLSGSISYRPLIEGSMSQKIGKDFEEVYYMQKKISQGNATYRMLTVGDGLRSCRTSRDLEAVVEPDFQKIYGGESNA